LVVIGFISLAPNVFFFVEEIELNLNNKSRAYATKNFTSVIKAEANPIEYFGEIFLILFLKLRGVYTTLNFLRNL
jgi:hypothetical protein